MKNIFIQILRVLMLFLLLISGVIGYIIYEDTLSEWWIPVGVALMIAIATFPFYMRWAWLTAGDNKIVNRWSFLERNRLVSGLADGIIICDIWYVWEL